MAFPDSQFFSKITFEKVAYQVFGSDIRSVATNAAQIRIAILKISSNSSPRHNVGKVQICWTPGHPPHIGQLRPIEGRKKAAPPPLSPGPWDPNLQFTNESADKRPTLATIHGRSDHTPMNSEKTQALVYQVDGDHVIGHDLQQMGV